MDVMKSIAEGWFNMAQAIPFPRPMCFPQTRWSALFCIMILFACLLIYVEYSELPVLPVRKDRYN